MEFHFAVDKAFAAHFFQRALWITHALSSLSSVAFTAAPR
jgi:hypothetical protein